MYSLHASLRPVLTLCAFFAATQSSFAATAIIGGMVVLDGQPLAAGKITFHQDNGQFVGSVIKDGKFAIDAAPIGVLKVTVEGKGVSPKYTTPETTALTVQTRAGKNQFDFDLTTK